MKGIWKTKNSICVVSLLLACSGPEKVISYNNTPPSVTIQEPSTGSTFYVGQNIIFKSFVQSENVDVTELSHQWSTSSQTVCEPEKFDEDGFGFCEWTYDNIGNYSMMVSVSGTSGSAQASVDLEILNNEAPVIEILSPEAGAAFASDETIVFDAEVFDSEESANNLIVSATSNISGDLGFITTPSSSGEFNEGTMLPAGQHLITMIVEDSYGRTDQDTVQLRIYDHGPPSADGVSISPANPTSADDLQASVQGWSDNEGGPESYYYHWLIEDENGVMQLEPNEQTAVFPSSRTVKGDLIQVEVVPFNSYGEGSPLLSSLVEILNTPPNQPAVTITPAFPQPNENLNCSPVGVQDVDNDPISYEYSWYYNGTLLGSETTAVLPSSLTEHGDVVSCQIRAYDGEEYSVAGSASVTILDTIAPNAPVIDAIGNYRNSPDVVLEGICEPDCGMVVYCSDATNSWADTLTCGSNGEFFYPTTFTAGSTTSCFATCEDAAGNVSNSSIPVTTEICSPTDVYEFSGIGNSSSTAISQWSPILDDGSNISIVGNILENDTDDWYVISSQDDVNEDQVYGIDYYNVAIEITTGTSDYEMVVYKGGITSTDLECSSTGYTSYNDFNQDVGDGDHAPPVDTRSCASNSISNNICADDSTEYYIHVFRTTSVNSCQNYQLTITNGVW